MPLNRTLATAAALALSTAVSFSAMAVPQYRLTLTDTATAGVTSNTFYNVTGTPVSTGAITFDGYSFTVNLNANYPGTTTVGTLSQSFTFSASLPGANRDFTSTLTIVDSGNQAALIKYSLPDVSGAGFQLVSDSANTANASISGGNSQVASQANSALAFNNVNPFVGGGNTPTATQAVAPDPTGYSLTNTIFFTGIVANGDQGLSSVTASATSSVQATPPTGVPEPASLALLGAGMFGAGLLRRRAKSK